MNPQKPEAPGCMVYMLLASLLVAGCAGLPIEEAADVIASGKALRASLKHLTDETSAEVKDTEKIAQAAAQVIREAIRAANAIEALKERLEADEKAQGESNGTTPAKTEKRSSGEAESGRKAPEAQKDDESGGGD